MCGAMLARGWVIAAEDGGRNYALTAAGRDGLARLGVPAALTAAEPSDADTGKRQLYGCVDWSERRDHFAGPLAVAMLDAWIARGWLRRTRDSRELALTATGSAQLAELVDISPTT